MESWFELVYTEKEMFGQSQWLWKITFTLKDIIKNEEVK